ncbi:MAG: FHIPEP family type III secretion protein, partial [Pseudomonadota bacterium]
AVVIGGLGYWFQEREKRQEVDAPKKEQETVIPERELGWEDVEHIDEIGLEVGYRLIPMVDKSQDGQLLGRIKGVRKKPISQ